MSRLAELRNIVKEWEEFRYLETPEATLLINRMTTNYAEITTGEEDVELVKLHWYGSHCEIPGMEDFEVIEVIKKF